MPSCLIRRGKFQAMRKMREIRLHLASSTTVSHPINLHTCARARVHTLPCKGTGKLRERPLTRKFSSSGEDWGGIARFDRSIMVHSVGDSCICKRNIHSRIFASPPRPPGGGKVVSLRHLLLSGLHGARRSACDVRRSKGHWYVRRRVSRGVSH